MIKAIRTIRRGEEVNIDYGFDFYAMSKEQRTKRACTQYCFSCQCVACSNNWPVYNDMVNKPRRWKVAMTQELMDEAERQSLCYQAGMEHLLRLDVSKALPLFRDFLVILNELVEHPDPRYIDGEEAYKQCLWLENRGYKPRPLPQQTLTGFPPQPPFLAGFSASNPRYVLHYVFEKVRWLLTFIDNTLT